MRQNSIIFISAILLMGCAKQTPDPAAAVNEQTQPVVVCPKFYRSSEDTDTYKRWDDDVANGVRCSDGKIYCFGDNQKPELIPEVPDGYECKQIGGYGDETRFKYEPDVMSPKLMSEDTDSVIQYPFCDNGSSYREVVKVNFSSINDQYAWECKDKECICGGKPCRYGSQCYREQCIESKYKWTFNEDGIANDYEIVEGEFLNDACEQAAGDWYSDYIYYRSQMTEEDEGDERASHMFKCGDNWIEKKSNMTCIPHPMGDIVKFDFCPELTEEQWKQYKDLKAQFDADNSIEKQTAELLGVSSTVSTPEGLGGKTAVWNIGFDKCQCGNEICAEDTGCYQNHCVDLANLQPLPDGFVWKTGRPYCEEDKCICDKDTCHVGQWCIEGRCFDHRDVMKIDNKYIQYGFYSYSRPMQINHYFDEETGQALPRDHYVHLDNLPWLDIITHRSTALCDDPVLPKNLDDYRCIVAHTDNGCDEGTVDSYGFYGWHCIKDEGCDCGTNHCGKHARCYHGQCIYDSVYLAMACGADITKWGMYAKADEHGWCACAASLVPPNLNGYVCRDFRDGEGGGMKCMLDGGCVCGDISCDYGDYCVGPGKCIGENALYDQIDQMNECANYHSGCECGDAHCHYLQYCVSPGTCADKDEMLQIVRQIIDK